MLRHPSSDRWRGIGDCSPVRRSKIDPRRRFPSDINDAVVQPGVEIHPVAKEPAKHHALGLRLLREGLEYPLWGRLPKAETGDINLPQRTLEGSSIVWTELTAALHHDLQATPRPAQSLQGQQPGLERGSL